MGASNHAGQSGAIVKFFVRKSHDGGGPALFCHTGLCDASERSPSESEGGALVGMLGVVGEVGKRGVFRVPQRSVSEYERGAMGGKFGAIWELEETGVSGTSERSSSESEKGAFDRKLEAPGDAMACS